jgi:hypothetical protein
MKARSKKPPACGFVNAHGACSAPVETSGGDDPTPYVFCREHRQHTAPIVQRLVVEVAFLDPANVWRSVVWTTALAQQRLAVNMRDDARQLLVDVLARHSRTSTAGVVGPPARDSELVTALANLARALTPAYPLVKRWREAWAALWPAVRPTDLPRAIGALEAQNAPATTPEQRPPAAPRGGGKAP